jgi:hypothetical protein
MSAPTPTITLHNFEKLKTGPHEAIIRALHNDVVRFLMTYAENSIETQVQPSGDAYPKKQPSTVKAYLAKAKPSTRKGSTRKVEILDTEHYLVASGESTEIIVDHTQQDTVIVKFRGQKILSYHVPFAEWNPHRGIYDRGLYPLELTPEAEQEILAILKTAIARAVN